MVNLQTNTDEKQIYFYYAVAREFEDSLMKIDFQTDRMETDNEENTLKLQSETMEQQ